MNFADYFSDGNINGLVGQLLPLLDSDPVARIFFLRIFHDKNYVFNLSESNVEAIAQTPCPEAYFAYGQILAIRNSGRDDMNLAHDCFRKAIDGNVPDALEAIALTYFLGDLGPLDWEKAREYEERAVRAGSEYGLLKMTYNMATGSYGYEKDPRGALKLLGTWRKSMEEHGLPLHPHYYLNIAITDEALGLVFAQEDHFRKAAEAGCSRAFVELYLRDEKDFRSYLETGIQRNIGDCLYLAACELTGPDRIAMLERAFASGSSLAAISLGTAFYLGHSLVEKDLEKALYYFKAAASRGDYLGFEAMIYMYDANDMVCEEEDAEMLVLFGARKLSPALMSISIELLKEGSLLQHKDEIETYFAPLVKAAKENGEDTSLLHRDDFFSNFDEAEDDLPDDDGRFDAWA